MFNSIIAVAVYTLFTFVVVVLEKDSKHIKSDSPIEVEVVIDTNRRGVIDTTYIYTEERKWK